MKKALLILGIALLTGCATTHPGKVMHAVDGEDLPGLKVSTEKEQSYSDRYHVFLNFTLENQSADPIRIRRAELQITEQSGAPAAILTDQDLFDWAEATDYRLKKQKHNSDLLFGFLTGAGLLGASLSSSPEGKVIGASAAAVGAGGWLVNSLSREQTEARTPQRVPNTHIYAVRSIPPANFIRKWAVVRLPKNYRGKETNLELEFEDGTVKTYAIRL